MCTHLHMYIYMCKHDSGVMSIFVLQVMCVNSTRWCWGCCSGVGRERERANVGNKFLSQDKPFIRLLWFPFPMLPMISLLPVCWAKPLPRDSNMSASLLPPTPLLSCPFLICLSAPIFISIIGFRKSNSCANYSLTLFFTPCLPVQHGCSTAHRARQGARQLSRGHFLIFLFLVLLWPPSQRLAKSDGGEKEQQEAPLVHLTDHVPQAVPGPATSAPLHGDQWARAHQLLESYSGRTHRGAQRRLVLQRSLPGEP